MRFVPHHLLGGRPNVIVDGAPTAGTVLTLTHWPGYGAPAGLARDLSAQMAFAYLDAGAGLHGAATAASNNHFDQDGLVGLLALTDPEAALARRGLLEDLASAGDFATFASRDAARLSMAVAAYADPARSPLRLEADSKERDAQLYTELLGLLPGWCDDPAGTSELWAEEDEALDRSGALFATGAAVLTERPEVDLAVVELPEASTRGMAHRFAHERRSGLHPMALAGVTRCGALLTIQGTSVEVRYRYETWVAYVSARLRPRRDLRPLAERLSGAEPAGVVWRAEAPGALEPLLAPEGGHSDLAPARVVAMVVDHLATTPPAWDPYRLR